ncbi:MAG: DUF5717 family protein [Lachnospiraceae bacterium]|jgi:hypothetical protein|nr:DUF5717 family protein [Lachnospiraceae bacterium]
MKDRIAQLAKGIIDLESPAVSVSVPAIEETVPTDETTRGFLMVSGEGGAPVRGFCVSTNPKVTIGPDSFDAPHSQLVYEVDVRYVAVGAKVEGAFHLVTDGGEFEVPYTFRVGSAKLGKVKDTLKTPGDFGRLVQEDFDTALRLFERDDFTESPFMKNGQTRIIYEGIRGHGHRFSQLEEFLVGLGVKEPVGVILRERKRVLERPAPTRGDDGAAPELESVVIEKNNWGYLPIVAGAEGSFLEIVNRPVGAEDFSIDFYRIFYRILPEKLHKGKNFGMLRIQAGQKLLTVEIEVKSEQPNPDEYLKKRIEAYWRKKAEVDAYIETAVAGIPRRVTRISQVPQSKISPRDDLDRLAHRYGAGDRGPFLYLEACSIWKNRPETLHINSDFEVQAVYCGARRGFFNREMAQNVADAILASRRHSPLFLRTCKRLYQDHPSVRSVLFAVCSLMLREDRRAPGDFVWYERALESKLNLTKLYEYFMYTLPEGYQKPLPKEVLLYFSYSSNLDNGLRLALYHNVLTHMDASDPLYEVYMRDISKFSLEQLLNLRMNDKLALIYERTIYREMLDMQMAKALPAILRANRLTCNNPLMKSVVVRYEELSGEEMYTLTGKVTYVPVFSPNCQVFFQDQYGCRFVGVPFTLKPVLRSPELEERCIELNPSHPMLLLQICGELLSQSRSKLTATDIRILEKGARQLKLHPRYLRRMQREILRFYRETNSGSDFLLEIRPKKLFAKERTLLLECLIANQYLQEANALAAEYGWDNADPRLMNALADRLVASSVTGGQARLDAQLLLLTLWLFSHGTVTRGVMGYLCAFCRGSSRLLREILEKAMSLQAATGDLKERLLAQMLFSGCREGFDQAFLWYTPSRSPQDTVVRAYFTVKSADYIMEGKPCGEEIFPVFENFVAGGMERGMPHAVYLIALGSYYADMEKLNTRQRDWCARLLQHLLGKGIVMPFMKRLARHIPIPKEIANQAMISYIGPKNAVVELHVRILPGEGSYRSTGMQNMFQGYFVRQLTLFAGETAQYRVYEKDGASLRLAKEGEVIWEPGEMQGAGDEAGTAGAGVAGAGMAGAGMAGAGAAADDDALHEEGRFAALNLLSFHRMMGDTDALQVGMHDYLMKDLIVRRVFG